VTVDDDWYPEFEVCPVCGVPVEDHPDVWCPADDAA
jgi:rubrerythrin